MINRYVEHVMKHRRVLLLGLALSLVLSLIGIKQLEIEVEFDIFSSQGSPYVETLDSLNKSFVTNQLTVLLSFDYATFELSDLLKALSVYQKAYELDSFQKSNSPVITTEQLFQFTRGSGFRLENSLDQLQLLGVLSPITVSGETLSFRVDLPIVHKLSVDDLHSLENHLDTLDIEYYLAGDDYMQNKLFDYILSILMFLPPLAIGSIVLVFSWQMGSIKATLLSVLPAIIASFWTMGMVGWVGKGVSITTVLAPIFTLIIGSADGLHFVSHFQEAFEKHKDKKVAVKETLEMVGMPMIVTTLTTMVGFLSLLTVGEKIVSTLVTIASIGVLLAGIATWWVLPILMTSKLTLKPVKIRNVKTVTLIKKAWGKPIVVVVLFLVTVTIFALPNLSTDFNQLMFYKENTELYKSFEHIEKTSGGGVPIMVAFEWDEQESPYDVSHIIEKHLEQNAFVSRVIGVNQMISAFEFLAPTETVFSGINVSENQFLDRERRIGRVIAFPNQLDDESLSQIEISIRNLPLNIPAKATSIQFIMRDLNDQMVRSQLPTQIIAFFLVFLLIVIALKKILPSLIALVPIMLTMFFLYGYLAITNIPLNLFTILMLSISIGIGIDYAIHFISVWTVYKGKNHTTIEALDLAFYYTSRPILANAIGLALGMSALMLSPLKIHAYLSLVMWFTMTSSVILTLTVIPTILKKVN